MAEPKKVTRGKKCGSAIIDKDTVRKISNTLRTQATRSNDTGLQTAVMGMSVAKATVKTGIKNYKHEQKIQTAVIKYAPKVIKKSIRTVKRGTRVIRGIKKGKIKVSAIIKKSLVKKATAVKKAVLKTVKPVIVTVKGVKTTVKVVRGIVKGEIKLGTEIKKVIVSGAKFVKEKFTKVVKPKVLKVKLRVGIYAKIVRGIKSGNIKTSLKLTGKIIKLDFKHHHIPNAKAVWKNAIKPTAKTVNFGVNFASKFGEELIKSGDIGLQSVGVGMQAPKVMKTVVKGGLKTGVATVKTGVKAVKGAVKGVQFVKNNGIKTVGNKIAKKVAEGAVNLAKGMLTKVLIPVIVGAVVVVMTTSMIAAPVAAVGSFFGGFLSWFSHDDDTDEFYEDGEIDVNETLTQLLTAERANLLNTLKSTAVSDIGVYHYGHFKGNNKIRLDDETNVNIGIDNISDDVLPTVEEYLSLIQPIYTMAVLSRYDTPTEDDLSNVFDEIWAYFCNISETAMADTYCVTAHTCGHRHNALSNCPNSSSGTHTSLVCRTSRGGCDGYTYTYDDYGIETSHFHCSGYNYCNGHTNVSITVTDIDFNTLLYNYFDVPIADLEAIINRTEEEELELQNLKDYRALVIEMKTYFDNN